MDMTTQELVSAALSELNCRGQITVQRAQCLNYMYLCAPIIGYRWYSY